MDQGKIVRQMIGFYKTTFDSSFNAMMILQEQTEKMVRVLLSQAVWLPEEGKAAVEEWLATYKTGRDEFKSTIDESYKKVESYFKIYKSEDKSAGGGK
jgi:hypothetical protein